MLVVDILQQNN